MKNFKFILLFVVALSMGFASCSKDDDKDVTPNINFKGGSEYVSTDAIVTVDQDFKIGITASYNAESGKKLKSVKYTFTSNNVVKLEFDSVFNETSFDLDYTFNFSNAGEGVFKFVVTDKDNQTKSISLTVTAEAVDTPLEAAADTFFERIGGADGTGLEGFGLKWDANDVKDIYAYIQKDAATKLVQLTAAEWTSITTVEALTAAVDAAADMDTYKGISASANGDYDDVLGVIHGGEYYMIHLTSATVAVDANGTTIRINGQSTK